jgi:hypothetical protein
MITHEGTTYTAENEFVYILSFKPRRRRSMKANYMYSENDYAVLRAEYTLEEGEN